MTTRTQHHDWDPRSETVIHDPIPAYDAMRQRCPVAHSEYQHWSVFRHADVLRVLQNHRTFSNAVSRYPDAALTIVVLTNRTGEEPWAIADALAARFLP